MKVYYHNKEDNVGIALKNLTSGIAIKSQTGDDVSLNEDIALGHKIAIKDIKQGGNIIRYGLVIGQATEDIKKGDHVHIHNVKSLRLE